MSRLALFEATAGELRLHPARAFIAVLAIAVGVAMGYAVNLINQSALSEFAGAVRSVTGAADAEIGGPRSGFDESVFATVAGLPMVVEASPLLEIDAAVAGTREKLRIIGIDPLRAAQVSPDLIGRLEDVEGASPEHLLAGDAIFLSAAAMQWLRVKPGDAVTLQYGLTPVVLRVAGTLPGAGAGARLATVDIATAQWRFGRLGKLSRIAVRLAAGTTAEDLRRALALPEGVSVLTPEQSAERTSNLSRAYRVNLNVLALVALFTGAFLVLSVQALSVVRRRPRLALLRVLGMRQAEVRNHLLLEGALLGVLGSLIGLALGYAVASFALTQLGADLGAGFFTGITPRVHLDAGLALLFFSLGLTAALAGTLVPAREAARMAPAHALKAGSEESTAHQASPWPAMAAMALGGMLSFAGPLAELPIAGFLAIGLILIGGIALTPRLARLVFGRELQHGNASLQLATGHLSGAANTGALALAGIVASFSLMVAMGIMVASFRASVTDWLEHVLPAELYVRAGSGDASQLDASIAERIAKAPGVARSELLRNDEISLDARRPAVGLIARPIDAANPAARLPLTDNALTEIPPGVMPIWVSEATLTLYGFTQGARVSIPLGGRNVEAIVAGVWRDYSRASGTIALRSADYVALTGDTSANNIALWLAPGAQASDVMQAIRSAVPGGAQLEFAQPGEIRTQSLKIFDRSFAITYVLEGVAIVIGLVGIAATFAAQAIARRKDFGMLRHLGFTRAQIAWALVFEGILLTLLGIIVGLFLGLSISLILVHVVNPQSFHWSMDMHIPWPLLSGVAGALLVAAALTALVSGRRAMSVEAVRAVREDW